MASIPGVDKPLSRIILGTMILHRDRLDESFALLDAAFACGVNAFDTASVYAGGDAQQCLGLWCADRGLRDQIFIADKGCHPRQGVKRVTPEALAADLDEALTRLKTDSIDLYMLHRDDPGVPVGVIVEMLNEHVTDGCIKAYGVSNWTLPRIQAALAYAAENGLRPLAARSPNFGLAVQVENPWGEGCSTLTGEAHRDERAWQVETQLPVLAYSSLGRGLFSGRITRENFSDIADAACQRAYCHEVNFQRLDRAKAMAAGKNIGLPQLALAYVLSSPMNVFPLVGAGGPEEIQQCVGALDIPLTAAEITWLETGETPA